MWGRAVGAVTRAEAGIATSLAVRTCALSLLTGAKWDGWWGSFAVSVPCELCASCSFLSTVRRRQRGTHTGLDRHKRGKVICKLEPNVRCRTRKLHYYGPFLGLHLAITRASERNGCCTEILGPEMHSVNNNTNTDSLPHSFPVDCPRV